MARVRLTPKAQADIEHILDTSEGRWGVEARYRYATLLKAATLEIATAPLGPATRARDELYRGLRSLHLRSVRVGHAKAKVHRPVHIFYFRALTPDLVEIVRVLHERTETSRHLRGPTTSRD